MEIPGVKALIDQAFKLIEQRTGGQPQCPFCSNNDWARLAGERVIEVPTVAEYEAGAEPVFATALGLMCTRCGFLRLHAIDPVLWGNPGDIPIS